MKNSLLIRSIILAGSLLLQLGTLCFHSRGAPGDLDLSFDPGFPGINGPVKVMAVQPDGKVIIGGEFTTVNGLERLHIARLNPDGSEDPTFNAAGASPGVDRYVSAIALQPDGKVLFTRDNIFPGVPQAGRLNSDGTVDSGFIPDTGIHPYDSAFTCVAVQPDGKVVVGGYFIDFYTDEEGFGYYYRRSLLIRLNADGSADTGFTNAIGQPEQPTGQFSGTSISSLAVQSDGKIVIGGHINTTINGTDRYGIARYNADGSLDGSFFPGADGYVESVLAQRDGKILIGGNFIGNGADRHGIARLNADGSLDGSFHLGIEGYTALSSFVVQPDGKVIIGGTILVSGTARSLIARLKEDGSLDGTFDPGTGPAAPENGAVAIALQPDGRVLIAGAFTTFNGVSRERMARLNADGSLDPGFRPSSGITGQINSIFLQPDGKVLAGGGQLFVRGMDAHGIARINPDGTPDNSFDPGTGIFGNAWNLQINSVVAQPDGKILIGGNFAGFNGTIRGALARLNSNGTLDNGFNAGFGSGGAISVALQANGKVLVVGGSFSTGFGRLDANGSLDASFNPEIIGDVGSNYAFARSIVAQPDGKVLVAGYSGYNSAFPEWVGDYWAGFLHRLNADGSFDASFERVDARGDPQSLSVSITAVALQPDGKVLIGGDFTNGVARLNANGTMDSSFNPGSAANGPVSCIVVQPDGRILLSGQFSTFNGTRRMGIARLNVDGSLDARFQSVTGGINAIALQPDGNVLVAGSFNTVNGVVRPHLARLFGDSQPPITFAVWIASFGLSGGAAAADADPDHDGLPNAVEYILGEHPSGVSVAESNRPAATISGGNMLFTFPREDASESSDVTLTVESGTDLVTWPAVFTIGSNTADSSPGVSITENGTAPDMITVTIPGGTATHRFARLKAMIAP